MCYWFLCVPFTRTFATTEESSTDAEESTCLRRGFLVSLDVVGYLILLATVVCLQGCLLLVLFLSGGHFRYKFGWFVNAFLSATIIIIIPTAISFILWSKRKNVSTPAEQILEMDSMSTIDSAPVETLVEQIVEMGTTSTIDLAPEVQLGELNVEIAESTEGIQDSEAGPSFVSECCAKRLLPFYIIVILLSEIALIFLNPFDSIFPIGIASDEIVVPLEGEFIRSKHCPSCPDHCTNIEQKVREARAFYKHSLVDFSVVRIGYGGIPKHFNDDGTLAMALDRSVYLALDACPETWLMVHELAHVWQMQSGWWFQNGVSKLIRYKKEEKKDQFALYDYGGLEGLRNAAENQHATMTSAFWVEQQAQIVEDYYECLHSFWFCSSEKQQLLMRFSNDILYDGSKLGKKSCEVEDLMLTWISSEDCPPKVLSLSEDLSEYYAYYAESANEIEAITDGVLGDGLQFPGCSSVYLNVKLKEGISSGFCECDTNHDLCNLSFNDAENQESSNCGIYDIYQWSCPNEAR